MFASVNDRLKRAEICHACEHYRRSTKQCQMCGCLASLKISWAESECPVGKWSAVAGGNDPFSQLQKKMMDLFTKKSSQDQK
jgi:hypothetical protein